MYPHGKKENRSIDRNSYEEFSYLLRNGKVLGSSNIGMEIKKFIQR